LKMLRLRRSVALLGIAAALAFLPISAPAQRGSPPAQKSAKDRAPVDFTGYWVSIVTEDWRWRMLTPPKGDFGSVPLNAEGQRAVRVWDLAKDAADGNQCKPFGVGGLMRMPGRLHITWQDPDTLKIEAGAGAQTRVLHFDKAERPSGEKSWQGWSSAQWDFGTLTGGARAPGTPGSLKVVTTGMRAGYVRKNGVPYSENTVLTEYYNTTTEPNEDQWLIVTTIVEDPKYLGQRFITSTHFKKEPGDSKWNPTPCSSR